MGFKTIVYEKKGDIAHVTLNRPEVLNVYNIQMRDELFQVLAAIRDDDEVRAALFSGAGDRAIVCSDLGVIVGSHCRG